MTPAGPWRSFFRGAARRRSARYFHTALDVSVCVGSAQGDPAGFYLPTLKASEQAGLTGMKGSILRKVAVEKMRSSLECGLATLKSSIEQTATRR